MDPYLKHFYCQITQRVIRNYCPRAISLKNVLAIQCLPKIIQQILKKTMTPSLTLHSTLPAAGFNEGATLYRLSHYSIYKPNHHICFVLQRSLYRTTPLNQIKQKSCSICEISQLHKLCLGAVILKICDVIVLLGLKPFTFTVLPFILYFFIFLFHISR